jgi:2-methylfumaryl-CoA hydratase
MTLNAALALGVQNDSEQAIAHLGYYRVEFLRPVYAGDTLRSQTEVLSRRPRSPDERGSVTSGIVRVRTQAANQEGQVVVRYERAILIPVGDASKLAQPGQSSPPEQLSQAPFTLELPFIEPRRFPDFTGTSTYFEDFRVGDVILHRNGRTITAEHIPWTYRLGNTHPLHYDRMYSSGLSGPMSGEPIVFGGFVFSWLEGLASRDVSENALWELGYTEGYHTQPAYAGDTLYAISRILARADGPAALGAGVMTLQLIGVKNVTGPGALDQYGASLFQKESTKSRQDRIPEKLFEIERRLLLKRRSAWS